MGVLFEQAAPGADVRDDVESFEARNSKDRPTEFLNLFLIVERFLTVNDKIKLNLSSIDIAIEVHYERLGTTQIQSSEDVKDLYCLTHETPPLHTPDHPDASFADLLWVDPCRSHRAEKDRSHSF